MRSPCALVMVGGMLTVLLQHLGHDILRGRGIYDDRAAAALRLHRRLHRAIDDGDQDRRAKALQEMPIDLPGQPRAAELIGPGRGQGHDDAGRRARLGPEHEDPRRALLRPRRGSRRRACVPRSRSTTLPSALKVSVAVMQVVMPGSVESIAVSSVQSMKAPFGNRKRCVGSTEAATAGVTRRA